MLSWKTSSHCLASRILGAMALVACGLAEARPSVLDANRRDLQLEVYFGGVSTGLIGSFRQDAKGALDAKRSELEELGLLVPEPFAPDDDVPLAAFPGLRYRYDEASQILDLDADPALRRPKHYDARGTPRPLALDTPTTGLVLNYLLFGSFGSDGTLPSWQFQGASATLDARLFSPWGVGSQTGILATNGGAALVSEQLRLDSTWTTRDPERILTTRIGDTISGGLAWTRPIRLGGVQLQRDFTLRPDLVTLPLPSYSGSAAVPSTVDIYVNDIRAVSQDIGAGPFRISNLPILTGQGNASVVVRESSGRVVETILPFFVSGRLLQAGLSDFSLEAGFPRLFYGARSNVYSDKPAGSASLRHGITDRVTLEAHAEATRNLVNGGLGAAVCLDSIGLVSAAVATSRYGSATGTQIYAAFETYFRGFALVASTRRTFGPYVDLATVSPLDSVTAAAAFFDVPPLTPAFFLPGALASLRPPRVLDQISIGVPLPFANGSFNLALINQQDYSGTRARIVNASYTAQLAGRSTFFANAFFDLGSSRNKGVAVGISIPLAPDVAVSTGVGRDRTGLAVATDVVKPLTQDLGSFGWRLRDRESASPFRSASAAYRGPLGRVEASVNQAGRGTYGTLQNEGAIVLAGGDAFLANRIDQAFAIVETGVPDLDVFAENRPVARTNKKGKALVPTLKAYQRNKVSIDPTGLPLNASIATTQEVISPPDRSGVVVDFGIATDTRAAIVVLTEPDGTPVRTGSRGTTSKGKEFVVGYDGRAFILGLEPENIAVVALADRDCRAEFAYEPKGDEQVVIGPVACR